MIDDHGTPSRAEKEVAKVAVGVEDQIVEQSYQVDVISGSLTVGRWLTVDEPEQGSLDPELQRAGLTVDRSFDDRWAGVRGKIIDGLR